MSHRARLLIVLVVLASSVTAVAYGYLTATSSRGATDPGATAGSLPAGSAPGAAATGGTVTVSVPQVAVDGQSLGSYAGGGYVLRRYAASATVDGTGTTPAGTCAAVLSGSAATLSCDDTGVPSGSWKYTVTPALNLWRGAESAAGDAVTVSGGDETAPQLVSLEMRDANANGKVDELRATFDEALATSTATAPWTLADVPSGGSLASVSTSGSVATVALTEGAGAADTAVGAFTVALAASAGGIRDAAGNRASFAARAPADRAKPVVASLALVNQTIGGGGVIQRNDQVVAVYSEALTTGTLVSAWTGAGDQSHGAATNNEVTVTIANGTGGANDALSVSAATATVRFGTIDLGSPAWVSATATFRGNSTAGRSSLAWTAAARRLTITLGGSTAVPAVASPVVATLTPNGAVTDLANPANALTAPFATPSQVQF